MRSIVDGALEHTKLLRIFTVQQVKQWIGQHEKGGRCGMCSITDLALERNVLNLGSVCLHVGMLDRLCWARVHFQGLDVHFLAIFTILTTN
jgi:hypothetical protein